MAERLVVVGGDAAGMSAASQARRLRPELEIVAYERGSHVSYSACGEPYLVGGEVDEIEELVARTPAQFAERDIEVNLHHEVREIDLHSRTVTVDHAGTRDRIGFDHLVYSTGARPRRPSSIEGIALPYALRSLDDAARLRDRVDSGVASALVVGGGYIGLEAAEAFVHRGVNVTLCTSGDHVLTRTLDSDMGEIADQAVRRLGIDLRTNHRVESVSATAASGEGFDLRADLVLLGLGTVPEVEVATAAGIGIGGTGAVATDEFQATDQEGIWSAGDCAEATHRVSGRKVNIALGTVANKAGRITGTNLAQPERKLRFPGVLGTAITKVGETEIARTGLCSHEAGDFDLISGSVQGTNTAGYWPTATRVDVKLLADRNTRRVVGGQIVGGPGSGKKIDVIALAIWGGISIDELAWVDFAYAPPFSGVWDLIHIAARRAAAA